MDAPYDLVLLGCVIAVAVLFYARERERRASFATMAMEHMADAVIATDALNRVRYLNPLAEQLTGWTANEAAGHPLERIFRLQVPDAGQSHPAFAGGLQGPAVGLQKFSNLIRKDGSLLTIQDATAPLRGNRHKVMGQVLVFRDATDSRALAERLRWQAAHDALTDLPNRREFEHCLGKLVAEAHALDAKHVLLYIDLDQFKVINDTCGHGAGDALLKRLASQLKARLRRNDVIARLGGDEFGVLLADCTIEDGRELVEGLRAAVASQRFEWEGKVFETTCSIGYVAITRTSPSAAQLLSHADAACYVAKDKGRNRTQEYFGGKDCTRKRLEMEWAVRIKQALDEGRFALYYQTIIPIVETQGLPVQREILLRMIDENGEVVPPAQFIPAAEKYSLMTAIDRLVVTKTLDWLVANPVDAKRYVWSINLSGQSLGDEAFLGFIAAELRRTEIPGERLCFEITETAAIADLARAQRFIAELKQLRCRFALDDFGSGMASYAYLKNLPVDCIKIDGGFIKGMVNDAIDQVMVESIHRVGQLMGIRTVAEFVENAAILARLKTIGVDYAQGFHLHRPEPLLATAAARRAAV